MNPYNDLMLDNFIIRKFGTDIDPIELKWHRDLNNRIISSLFKTNWMIQIDNELPRYIDNEIHIPKLIWHRLIKGGKELYLKIIEL
jgi:hypothetical protein